MPESDAAPWLRTTQSFNLTNSLLCPLVVDMILGSNFRKAQQISGLFDSLQLVSIALFRHPSRRCTQELAVSIPAPASFVKRIQSRV